MNMKWKEALKHLSEIVNLNNQCTCAEVRLIIANNTNDEEILWSMRDDSSTRVLAAVARRTTDRDHMLELIRGDYNLLREPVLEKLSDDDIRMLAAESSLGRGSKYWVINEAKKRRMQDIIRNEIENAHAGESVLPLLDYVDNLGEYLWSIRDKVAGWLSSSTRVAYRLIVETTSIERLESLYCTYEEPLITEIAKRIETLRQKEDVI